MQISAKADYAVRALAELAADTGRPLTCEAIATSQDIPFRFLKAVFREPRDRPSPPPATPRPSRSWGSGPAPRAMCSPS
ncbi:hypothetical protein ACWEWX_52640, partial [Streptomyces asiaticus]